MTLSSAEKTRRYRERHPDEAKASLHLSRARSRGTPQTLRAQRTQDLKKYGLSVDQYDAMFVAQHGVCAVCLKVETTFDPRCGKVRKLAVDHDHTTGRVRGLLCRECNTGLGHFKDSPSLLRMATAYLEKD